LNFLDESEGIKKMVGVASFSIIGDAEGHYSPTDVSADGSVVVGHTAISGVPARSFHLLTQSSEMEMFGSGESSFGAVYAYGVSADGEVVVCTHAKSLFSPFYWTRNNGMVFLPNPGSPNVYATAASSDGSVMVGFSTPTPGLGQALRWTKNGDVTVALDHIAGYEFSIAYDVSDDGSVSCWSK
jgi:uncharacterized membrane protein